MSGTLYEVAAITVYTERAVNHQNETSLQTSYQQSSLSSGLPQVSNNKVTFSSSSGHLSSGGKDSYANFINYSQNGLDSVKVGVNDEKGLPTTETDYYERNDTAYLGNPLILSKEACVRNGTDFDDDYSNASSCLASVKEANKADAQDQAVGPSSALWKDKFEAALDNIFDDFPLQQETGFVQSTSSLSGTSGNADHWFDYSISHREGSISSSYWGGSSACTSTGVSVESDIDGCPLLASTMIEMENKFTTEEEILEAMQRVQILAEQDASANANYNSDSVPELAKGESQEHGVGTDDNLSLVKNGDSGEIENISKQVTETSSNFLDEAGKDDFPQEVEENIRHVAKQLFELQQSNVTASHMDKNDPPKAKSYRDVLIGVASTAQTSDEKSEHNVATAKFLCAIPSTKLVDTNANFKTSKQASEETKKHHVWNNSNNVLQLDNLTKRVTTNSIERSLSIPASDNGGNLIGSFHSAQSSVTESSSDGGTISSSESSIGEYRTALSQFLDSGDESSQARDFRNVASHRERCDSTKECKNPGVHRSLQHRSSEKGSFDNGLNCKVSGSEACDRTRKRQRAPITLRHTDSDSCTTEDDMPTIKYQTRPHRRAVLLTKQRMSDSVSFSNDNSSSSSVRSSGSSRSNSTDKMSASRDSSASSRSSTSLSSSAEASEPGTKRLNPNCPPFIPRASRLRAESSMSSSSSFTDLRELTQEEVSAQTSGIESEKSRLETSLMPPPLSTKVPVGGNPYLKRLNQLRFSSPFRSDSGIDVTSQYNTSVNMSGVSLIGHAMQDSVFSEAHSSENLIEGNNIKSDICMHFGAHVKHPIESDTSKLINTSHAEENSEAKTYTDSKFTNFQFNAMPNETQVNLKDLGNVIDLLEPSPYICQLKHDFDFLPISDLAAESEFKICKQNSFLFRGLTPHVLSMLISLSQRVVRLHVSKPLATSTSANPNFLVESDNNQPNHDHYGTGFVYNINQEFFEIRTHEAVVSNAKEAAEAEIIFELLIAGDRQTFVSSCIPNSLTVQSALDSGVVHDVVNFINNAPHSQVTTFRRATPAQLIPWLHLFLPIPTQARNSFFEDSCYFSDCSPNSSLAENNSNVAFQFSDQPSKWGTFDNQLGVEPSLSSSKRKSDEVLQLQTSTWNEHNNTQPLSNVAKTSSRLYQRKAGIIPAQRNRCSLSNIEATEHANDYDLINGEAFSWNEMVRNTSIVAADMRCCLDNGQRFHSLNSILNETDEDNNYAINDLVCKLSADDCQACNSTETYDSHSVFQFERHQGVSVGDINNNVVSQLDVVSVEQSSPKMPVSDLSAAYIYHNPGTQNSHFQREERRFNNKEDLGDDRQTHTLQSMVLRKMQISRLIENNKCLSIDSSVSGNIGSVQHDGSMLSESGNGQIDYEYGQDTTHNKRDIAPCKPVHQEGIWQGGPSSYPLTPGAPTSCGPIRRQKVKDFGDDHRPSSPLVIMERRAAAEGRTTMSGVGLCPYSGVDLFGQSALYTCFSSYAGNTIDSFRDALSVRSENPPSGDRLGPTEKGWEYANLLFGQNSHRKAYTKQFVKSRPGRNTLSQDEWKGSINVEDSSSDSVFLPDSSEQRAVSIKKTCAEALLEEQETEADNLSRKKSVKHLPRDYPFRSHRFDCDGGKELKRVYAPNDPFEDVLDDEKYRASWDMDLLNLNPDLTPAQEPLCVESSLNHIFADMDESQTCCQTSKAGFTHAKNEKFSPTDSHSPSENFVTDARSIIISHPHGGRKMLSNGYFSRHYHVGGNLYDTPTCMGSCGAPVISLASDGSGLRLTSLVHAGNVTINGVTTGIGVEYFPPLKS